VHAAGDMYCWVPKSAACCMRRQDNVRERAPHTAWCAARPSCHPSLTPRSVKKASFTRTGADPAAKSCSASFTRACTMDAARSTRPYFFRLPRNRMRAPAVKSELSLRWYSASSSTRRKRALKATDSIARVYTTHSCSFTGRRSVACSCSLSAASAGLGALGRWRSRRGAARAI
jgi:hypothetical protein